MEIWFNFRIWLEMIKSIYAWLLVGNVRCERKKERERERGY